MAAIGIMGALQEEIDHYIPELAGLEKTELVGFAFFSGKLAGKDAVVVKSGAGKVNASICAQVLITNFRVSSIVFTGVAGALNPELGLNDIVISKDSMQHDIDATDLGFERGRVPFSELKFFNASKELAECASAAARKLGLKAIEGRILTGDQFIASRERSALLRKEFRGDCVDMESAAVAHVCALNNVPHLIIRSISDRADHSAPVDFTALFRAASENSFRLVKELVSNCRVQETGGKGGLGKRGKSGKGGKAAVAALIKSKIRTVPDWPKKGIMFRDITTLLKDKGGFTRLVNLLVERYEHMGIDLVAGIESRGFITGAVLANRLGLGFALIRKAGKLPAETVYEEYSLEYGRDRIEMHKDAIEKGQKVLLVDDLIATGGTALAACKLIQKLGGEVIEASFIINLPSLKGKERLEAAGFRAFSIVDFEGE
ncbi:Hypoxanthine/guanine phosphoribosyltransferase [uncultured archaeon]|nr:Hypoxanthine/guanine phosphoribosyltransferase [uncultured archaeon]